MLSYNRRLPSGHFTCYLNRTYHVLTTRYRVEVVDLLKNPQLAAGDQIVAVPTLVRRLPPPLKRIIGDLSNSERVIVGLDLRPGKVSR